MLTGASFKIDKHWKQLNYASMQNDKQMLVYIRSEDCIVKKMNELSVHQPTQTNLTKIMLTKEIQA